MKVGSRALMLEYRRGAVVMVLAALCTLFAWALSSAPGSSPDDNYHLPSIWCAGGGDATCPAVPEHPDQMRPPLEVQTAPCFAQQAERSARCQKKLATGLGPGGPYAVGNWNAKSYPPLFYGTMNQLIQGSLYNSVVLMRVFNAVLAVAAVWTLVVALPRRLKSLGVVPLVLTSVPLGLSLISSTNPSSWAVVSSALVWPALYASFETSGRRRALLLAMVGLGVLLGAGSRGDAALFTMVGIGMALLLRIRVLARRPASVVAAILGLVVSAWLFLTSGQSTVVVSGGFGVQPETVFPWYQVAFANLTELPVLWVGSLGFGFMGSLGWLDTPMPAIVGFCSTVVWATYLFIACREMYLPKLVGICCVAGAMVVYPLVMLGLSGVFVGTGFQPRYLLPLLVMLTGVAMLSRRVVTSPFTRTQAIAATLALATGQAVALHTQLRRYITGLDARNLNLDSGREWWWDIPVPAMAVWLIGTVCFAVLVWHLLRPGGILGQDEVRNVERELQARRGRAGRAPSRRPERVGA